MAKKILILSGSPKKNGNTAMLVEWFSEAARAQGAEVEVVLTAFLNYKANGCTSCRACQNLEQYECVIDDEARPILARMPLADVIVLATPLYFFSASAQLKLITDRMFSLYKWNNESGSFSSPLKGKTLVFLGSAFEDAGLDVLEKPFAMTAQYTGMRFESLLVPHAGVSGDIKAREDIREKAVELGKRMAEAV
jgi:multimeric flavodoxin WrbA